jgi:hypothetical protein
MGVVRDDLAGAAEHGEQDLLGGAALVGRNDVPEREEISYRFLELVERRRPGIALVAVLYGSPLVTAHRACARVSEEIDQNVVGMKVEQVQAGHF